MEEVDAYRSLFQQLFATLKTVLHHIGEKLFRASAIAERMAVLNPSKLFEYSRIRILTWNTSSIVEL